MKSEKNQTLKQTSGCQQGDQKPQKTCPQVNFLFLIVKVKNKSMSTQYHVQQTGLLDNYVRWRNHSC